MRHKNHWFFTAAQNKLRQQTRLDQLRSQRIDATIKRIFKVHEEKNSQVRKSLHADFDRGTARGSQHAVGDGRGADFQPSNYR